jgi:hypothetical protein
MITLELVVNKKSYLVLEHVFESNSLLAILMCELQYQFLIAAGQCFIILSPLKDMSKKNTSTRCNSSCVC